MQISRTESESVLTLDPSGLTGGIHELVIESYDEHSSVQSALKTDTILINVPQTEIESDSETETNEPEIESYIEPEILSETEQEVGTKLSFKN